MTYVYWECKLSGQTMGKELQTFSVTASSWKGTGRGRSKYRRLEPAHEAVWVLLHHAAAGEKGRAYTLQKRSEELSLAASLFPSPCIVMAAIY